VRDVAVFEIEFVRGDVFEPLRAEIHGERAGYFREDARAVKNARCCYFPNSSSVHE